MISEAELWSLLLAWRSDVLSDPVPTLVDTDTALAVLAAVRGPARPRTGNDLVAG